MRHGKRVQGRLLIEPQEIAEAKALWWQIAQVSRPTPDDWKAMRRLKVLFGITTAGDWPFLRYLTEELLGRAERHGVIRAKDLKVGDKVWYVADPTAPPLACAVQRISEGYRVAVRLLEPHPEGKKVVTISPSSALTQEEAAERRRRAAAGVSGGAEPDVAGDRARE